MPEVEWCKPGENAAMEVLMGIKDGFLTKRLRNYSTDRNNPLKPKALSGLSPYLHFGQISAQRVALEAQAFKKSHSQVGFPPLDYFLSIKRTRFLIGQVDAGCGCVSRGTDRQKRTGG